VKSREVRPDFHGPDSRLSFVVISFHGTCTDTTSFQERFKQLSWEHGVGAVLGDNPPSHSCVITWSDPSVSSPAEPLLEGAPQALLFLKAGPCCALSVVWLP